MGLFCLTYRQGEPYDALSIFRNSHWRAAASEPLCLFSCLISESDREQTRSSGMMRCLAWALLLLVSAAVSASAQGETRGSISGTVRDAEGVVPGATVKVINVETNGTRTLTSNERGYYEAVLLNPGEYRVEVEMQGFKKVNRPAISLGVAQSFTVDFVLEVGALTESITVSAESPLLDTSTVSSGQNFDRRMVEGLPMFSNMPIMLSRFTPGVAPADTDVLNIFQGYMEGTTSAAG